MLLPRNLPVKGFSISESLKLFQSGFCFISLWLEKQLCSGKTYKKYELWRTFRVQISAFVRFEIGRFYTLKFPKLQSRLPEISLNSSGQFPGILILENNRLLARTMYIGFFIYIYDQKLKEINLSTLSEDEDFSQFFFLTMAFCGTGNN